MVCITFMEQWIHSYANQFSRKMTECLWTESQEWVMEQDNNPKQRSYSTKEKPKKNRVHVLEKPSHRDILEEDLKWVVDVKKTTSANLS